MKLLAFAFVLALGATSSTSYTLCNGKNACKDTTFNNAIVRCGPALESCNHLTLRGSTTLTCINRYGCMDKGSDIDIVKKDAPDTDVLITLMDETWSHSVNINTEHQNDAGRGFCRPNEYGTGYSSFRGGYQCHPCPQGTGNKYWGIGSRERRCCYNNQNIDENGQCQGSKCASTEVLVNGNCVCAAGYYEDANGVCTGCPCGYESNGGTSGSSLTDRCNRVPEVHIDVTKVTQCVCAAGYYEDANGVCTGCPCGYESNGGTSGSSLTDRCTSNLKVVNPTNSSQCICPPPLIQVVSDDGGVCMEPPEEVRTSSVKSFPWWIIGLIAFAVLMLLLLVLCRKKKKKLPEDFFSKDYEANNMWAAEANPIFVSSTKNVENPIFDDAEGVVTPAEQSEYAEVFANTEKMDRTNDYHIDDDLVSVPGSDQGSQYSVLVRQESETRYD